MNLQKAAKVIEFVRSLGAVDFCLCAGARNSPFITLLDENKSTLLSAGHIHHFFEERSASFFALGRAQQSHRPVVVITTSGTAATELISAAVEAFYTKTPLIFITADRPPSYRQTGAPQAIEQLGIFSHYALPTVDIDTDVSLLDHLQWDQKIPLHLNVCFDEPLLAGAVPSLSSSPSTPTLSPARESGQHQQRESGCSDELKSFFERVKHPVFIISGLTVEERRLMAEPFRDFQGACWIETLSGLRGDIHLEPHRIKSGERWIQKQFEQKKFDGLIRIGSVPTTRIWRDMEDRFRVPVLSLTNSPWSGLARPSHLAPLAALSQVLNHYHQRAPFAAELREQDLFLYGRVHETVDRFPGSQLALVRALSRRVQQQPLYLGNSLPVREWDWIAVPNVNEAITGNRGANGIDGQLSTFFGWMPEGSHSWALLGDLTTLYDLSAPWIVSQLAHAEFTLAVMNNGGGHIFKPMFNREAFLNRHAISFKGWAEMWGLTYLCLSGSDELPQKGPQVLELRPDEQQTQALRLELENLWKQNL